MLLAIHVLDIAGYRYSYDATRLSNLMIREVSKERDNSIDIRVPSLGV